MRFDVQTAPVPLSYMATLSGLSFTLISLDCRGKAISLHCYIFLRWQDPFRDFPGEMAHVDQESAEQGPSRMDNVTGGVIHVAKGSATLLRGTDVLDHGVLAVAELSLVS